MEKLEIYSADHWMNNPVEPITELTLDNIRELVKRYDIMLYEHNGKIELLLDTKTRMFRQR